jgi:hypothetical protein
VNNAFQQKGFFAARGLCPANQAKPGLQNLAPLAFALCHRFGKYCYALAAAQATIVLPDFIRSCSADGNQEY